MQKPEQIFGPETRAQMARQWNQAVDYVSEPVIAELSKRNL